MLEFYQNLPLHIEPVAFAIGHFSVRWYGLSYLVGFGIVYVLLSWRLKKGEMSNIIPISKQIPKSKVKNKEGSYEIQDTKYEIRNTILDFLLISFLWAIVGGRLGFVLFYDFGYFIFHPWAIVSPYNSDGIFVGIYGMSYHGALLGILFGSWIFLKRKGIDFFQWADFIVPCVSLGYFFGRIGNFLNGELFGRLTDSKVGMYFLADPTHLRHPSQLYEAFFEGLILFVIFWKIRNRKFKKGTLLAFFLVGYGSFRAILEQFRQPDESIGFLLGFLTMGQILSLGMIILGLLLLVFQRRK